MQKPMGKFRHVDGVSLTRLICFIVKHRNNLNNLLLFILVMLVTALI